MAFDFPANPTENQEFTPAGGPTYIYKAPRWLALNFTQGTVPEAPNTGAKYARQSLAWYDLAADFSAKVSKTGDTMTGDLTIANAASHSILNLNAINAALSGLIDGKKLGVLRWRVNLGTGTAESGGNTGSDFTISRFTDAGAGLGAAFTINRATGIIDMPLGATTLTPPVGDNDTSVATTQFVTRADASVPVVPNIPGDGGQVDWNTMTTPGWYAALVSGYAASASNAPPVPTTSYFYCQVLSYAGTNLTQIAYPYSHSTHPAINMGWWYRGRFSGVWSAWKQLAPATAEARNRIVNPAFQISQENGDTGSAASAVNAAYYAADQWYGRWSVSPGAISISRMDPSGIGANGSAGVYLGVATAKAALAATDYALITQKVEGINIADLLWGTSQAKSIVLRFAAMASTTGLYSVRICNSAANRSYVAQFNLTGGVATTVVLSIPGDTTGTWLGDTGIGMWIDFVLGVGSTYTGVAGAWQAGAFMAGPGQYNGVSGAGNTLFITDVGLYADPNKTGLAPPFEVPDEAEELRACKRYYDKDLFSIFTGDVTSGSNYYNSAYLNVTPRPGATVAMVNVSNTLFPATALALTLNNNAIREQRGPATTSAVGIWQANYIVNGRL